MNQIDFRGKRKMTEVVVDWNVTEDRRIVFFFFFKFILLCTCIIWGNLHRVIL